jgi:hypothetical protein
MTSFSMKPYSQLAFRLFALAMLICCSPAQADDSGIWSDGTWQLVMRKLPDGTILTPPTVQGLSTNKNGVNQLIVFWQTPDGKPASISQIFKFEISEMEMVATPVLTMFDDGSGKPPVYALGGETKRVPIKREAGRVSHQHPLNPPFIVIEGDKSTATLEGVFVDYWEKVK